MTAAWAAGRDYVDLDAPVGARAPDLPEGVGRASLAELLTHTAGLDDSPLVSRFPGEPWPETTPEEELALLSDRVILTDPGVIRSFSRFSYLVAAHALERAAGRSFEALFGEAFTEPLTLRGTVTSLADAGDLVPLTGHAWARDPAGPFAATPVPDESLLRPHERIWTTGRDLAELVAAWLAREGGPAAEAFERAAVPRVRDPAAAPGEAAFGLGVELRASGERTLLRAQGGGFGFTASLLVLADRSLAVLVLTNGSEAPFSATAGALFDALGAPPADEQSPAELPADPLRPVRELGPPVAGTYRNGAELLRVIELPDGALAVDVGTPNPLRLRALADGEMDAHLPDGRSAMRFRLYRDGADRLYAVLRGRAFKHEGP